MTSRQDEVLDAAAGLHDLIDGYRRTQVLCTAARLGVADMLAGGPLTLAEMAAEYGMPCGRLGRLMRALVGLGVCTSGEEGYRTTALGRALEADAPGGAHDRALGTAELFYPMWADLTDSLFCGGGAVEDRSRRAPIDLPGGTDGLSSLFDRAMEDLSEAEARHLASVYELPEGAVIVDVGGSADSLLAELLHTHPDCRAVLYDLPGATDRARFTLAEAGLGGRADVAEGDFLVDVPAGGDVYLLSFVLHAWDDDRATALLRAVRRAMHPHARLLVVEQLMPCHEEDAHASLQDLHMLVTTGGRERTETDHATLLATAGLRHTGTLAVGERSSLVEARPECWSGFAEAGPA